MTRPDARKTRQLSCSFARRHPLPWMPMMLGAAILFFGCSSEAPKTAEKPVQPSAIQSTPFPPAVPGKFRIVGLLRREDKSPLVGASVTLGEVKETKKGLGFAYSFDQESRPLNPTAKTDPEGRYFMDVDPNFLSGKQLGVQIEYASPGVWESKKGTFALQLPRRTGEINLGEIIVREGTIPAVVPR